MADQSSTPFAWTGATFREGLLANFLGPTARWLLGEEDSDYVLSQHAGSNWETALSLEFIATVSDLSIDSVGTAASAIDEKLVNSARWMLGSAEWMPDKSAHWEGVTWDTAVCARATLGIVRRYGGTHLSDAEVTQFERTVEGALSWMAGRFSAWVDNRVRYPFGPADVAQMLNSIVRMHLLDAGLVERALGGADSYCRLCRSMVDYLLASQGEVVLFGGPDTAAHWADYFQSAEVMDALGEVLRCPALCLAFGSVTDMADVRASLQSAAHGLECTQEDGMWGNHADTCAALGSYIRACSTLGIGHEDHIVLKSLRWTCDEKQRFPDGSFLHSVYLTLFHASAVLAAYFAWPVSLLNTQEAFDVALWSSPVRTTPERTRRLQLELVNSSLERRIRRLERSRAKWFAYAWASVALFISFGLVAVMGVVAKLYTLGPEYGDKRALPDLLAYLGVSVPLAIALTGVVFAIARRDDLD